MCTAHSIVARSAAHPRTGQPRMYGVRTPRPGTTGRTGTGQNYSENVALSWYGSALIGMGVDLPSTSDRSSIGMSADLAGKMKWGGFLTNLNVCPSPWKG